MKRNKKILNRLLTLSVFISLTALSYAQTAGSLSFSANTTAPSGDWGNKHVLAIWIENTQQPAAFVKTNAIYGNQDDHLTSWVAISNKNEVDAVTGSTLTGYGTQSVIWNGTNVNSIVVPDGDYKVYIEMGWGKDKVNQHSVYSFIFTKGSSEVHLTPTGNSNYTNVKVDWVPVSTLGVSSGLKGLSGIYPNPTTGILNLEIKESIPGAKLALYNSLGEQVYKIDVENGFTGNMRLDISDFRNGMYLLKLISPQDQYVYKVMLQK